ncbi:MAG: GH3 auxin-responsive promoter family protein [Opitutaceae bacterium]|nr:GH3 auxin-responsive promoter family protein [Opitutaceae bacterium]
MSTIPQSLVTFGAGLLTARVELRLRLRHWAVPAQESAFKRLLGMLAATAQGRADGIEARMPYRRFAARLPIRTHEDFRPQIERMKQGEADVLWPGHCPFFAATAGTTSGEPRHLPVTEGMLRHFRRMGPAALLSYTARVGHAGIFRGRHLVLGGSTALTRLAQSGNRPAYAGDILGINTLNLPRWAEKHYVEPGAAIGELTDWSAKLDAIARRCRGRDITLLAGSPNWLLGFAEHLGSGRDGGPKVPHLRALWPNLECVLHTGVPLDPYAAELAQACGPGVRFHEVYGASEGLIAVQDRAGTQGLRLLADGGLFFEFLPLADYDEERLAELGSKVVPLAGVERDRDYVILLTTPAGLTRYVLGDVVRFVSTTPPRLIYVGRTQLQLNAFGERLIEKEITDALVGVCREHAWSIFNFHVAPHRMHSITGQTRGRHEWWIELRAGTAITPRGPLLEDQLDEKLLQLNAHYAARRKAGTLLPPVVRLVMPGTFESWMRRRGKWGGHAKMPRCRSDRDIADELAQLTRFRPETAAPWEQPAAQ